MAWHSFFIGVICTVVVIICLLAIDSAVAKRQREQDDRESDDG